MSSTFLLRAFFGASAALFLALVGWSLRDTSIKEGDAAPDFHLTTDSGQPITPTAFGGKLLVLNFWATWCAPCVREIPSLNEFQRRFRDSGVVVLAVSIDRNEQKYRRFLRRFGVSFATARDPSAQISSAYGTVQIPETYLIRNGRIERKLISDQNWVSAETVDYVKSLL